MLRTGEIVLFQPTALIMSPVNVFSYRDTVKVILKKNSSIMYSITYSICVTNKK